MSFRSIDHSSPVSITLDPDAFKDFDLPTHTTTIEHQAFDDSKIRAHLEHLISEVYFLKGRLDEFQIVSPLPAKEPKEFDYKWADKHLNDFKTIVKNLGYNRELLTELWGENFTKALQAIMPSPLPPVKEKPYDPVLRVSAIISSASLLVFLILFMLQYNYN